MQERCSPFAKRILEAGIWQEEEHEADLDSHTAHIVREPISSQGNFARNIPEDVLEHLESGQLFPDILEAEQLSYVLGDIVF